MGSKRGGGNPKAYKAGIQKYIQSIRLDDSNVFVKDSTYARHLIKARVVNQKMIEYKCAECGNDGHWMGKELPLILDHINGINNDNRLENLRFVCSNCDSQLPTYKNRRGNKKKI